MVGRWRDIGRTGRVEVRGAETVADDGDEEAATFNRDLRRWVTRTTGEGWVGPGRSTYYRWTSGSNRMLRADLDVILKACADRAREEDAEALAQQQRTWIQRWFSVIDPVRASSVEPAPRRVWRSELADASAGRPSVSADHALGEVSYPNLVALGLANRVGLSADDLGAELVAGSVVVDSAICDYAGVDLRSVVVQELGLLDDVDAHPAFITADRSSSKAPTPNRPKAHLVDWHAPIIDQGDIVTLEVARSDYWSSEATKRTMPLIQAAVENGEIDLMQLPRRLDVHLVVVCGGDDQLLIARRGNHVATEPSTWMITVGESMDWERDRGPDGVPHPELTARHCLSERDELNLPVALAKSADFRLVAVATEWEEMLVNLVVVARVPGLTAPAARRYFRRGENSQLDAVDFTPRACAALLSRPTFTGSRGAAPEQSISDISRVALLAALRSEHPLSNIVRHLHPVGDA